MLLFWSLQHDESRYCDVNRRIMSGEGGEDEHPLIDVFEGIKSSARTSKKAEKKVLFFEEFFLT